MRSPDGCNPLWGGRKVLRPYGLCVSGCGLMVCTHYIPKTYLYKRMAFEMHRKNLIAGFADAMRFVSIIQCSQNLCPLALYSHYNFDR